MARNLEADRRSRAKYLREKTHILAVRFNKAADKDIIEYLDSQPSKIETLRAAIRLYMEMSQN